MKAETHVTLHVLGMSVIFLSGCTAFQPYTAPGIQPIEARILTKEYYWQRDKDPKYFSDTEINELFNRTHDVSPSMDGERSELLTSELIWALAAAGDAHFASLLSHQPLDVQRRVMEFINPIWTYDHLNYPKTQALER